MVFFFLEKQLSDSRDERHVKPERIRVFSYHGPNRQRLASVWQDFDVVLTNYGTVRSEHSSAGPIFDISWARVILDEGRVSVGAGRRRVLVLIRRAATTTAHNIRNRSSRIFEAAEAIRAQRRWCLTGTPIQNCLDDYGALLSFIRVPPFETQVKFHSYITDPIKKRKDYAFTRLRALIQATCLRRTKQSIGETLKLPEKEEVNVVLTLNPADRELYDFFKIQAATAIRTLQTTATPTRPERTQLTGGGGWSRHILPLINNLRLICDHGEDLLPETAVRAWRERDLDSVDWWSVTAGLQKCDSCGVEPKEDDAITFPVKLSCGHIICTSCCADKDTSERPSTQTPCTKCFRKSPIPSQAGISKDYHPSVKIEALLKNLASEGSTLSVKGEGQSSCKRYVLFQHPSQGLCVFTLVE